MVFRMPSLTGCRQPPFLHFILAFFLIITGDHGVSALRDRLLHADVQHQQPLGYDVDESISYHHARHSKKSAHSSPLLSSDGLSSPELGDQWKGSQQHLPVSQEHETNRFAVSKAEVGVDASVAIDPITITALAILAATIAVSFVGLTVNTIRSIIVKRTAIKLKKAMKVLDQETKALEAELEAIFQPLKHIAVETDARVADAMRRTLVKFLMETTDSMIMQIATKVDEKIRSFLLQNQDTALKQQVRDFGGIRHLLNEMEKPSKQVSVLRGALRHLFLQEYDRMAGIDKRYTGFGDFPYFIMEQLSPFMSVILHRDAETDIADLGIDDEESYGEDPSEDGVEGGESGLRFAQDGLEAAGNGDEDEVEEDEDPWPTVFSARYPDKKHVVQDGDVEYKDGSIEMEPGYLDVPQGFHWPTIFEDDAGKRKKDILDVLALVGQTSPTDGIVHQSVSAVGKYYSATFNHNMEVAKQQDQESKDAANGRLLNSGAVLAKGLAPEAVKAGKPVIDALCKLIGVKGPAAAASAGSFGNIASALFALGGSLMSTTKELVDLMTAVSKKEFLRLQTTREMAIFREHARNLVFDAEFHYCRFLRAMYENIAAFVNPGVNFGDYSKAEVAPNSNHLEKQYDALEDMLFAESITESLSPDARKWIREYLFSSICHSFEDVFERIKGAFRQGARCDVVHKKLYDSHKTPKEIYPAFAAVSYVPTIYTCADDDIMDIKLTSYLYTDNWVQYGYVKMHGGLESPGELNADYDTEKKVWDRAGDRSSSSKVRSSRVFKVLRCSALRRQLASNLPDPVRVMLSKFVVPISDLRLVLRPPNSYVDKLTVEETDLVSKGYERLLYYGGNGDAIEKRKGEAVGLRWVSGDAWLHPLAKVIGKLKGSPHSDTADLNYLRHADKPSVFAYVLRGGPTPLTDIRLYVFQKGEGVPSGFIGHTYTPYLLAHHEEIKKKCASNFDSECDGKRFTKKLDQMGRPVECEVHNTITPVTFKLEDKGLWKGIKRRLLRRQLSATEEKAYMPELSVVCPELPASRRWVRIPVSPYTGTIAKENALHIPYLWIQKRYIEPAVLRRDLSLHCPMLPDLLLEDEVIHEPPIGEGQLPSSAGGVEGSEPESTPKVNN